MKVMFYIFFLNLLIFKGWYMYIFMYSFLIIMLCFYSINNFFISISYTFGMDNYSYLLIILSLFLSNLMILSSTNICSKFFMFINSMICIVLVFIFSVINMFYMYLFFEFSLIPLIILLLGWGYQPERLISVMYLFFYTLFASLPLLLIIMYFYMMFGSLFYDYFYGYSLKFIFHFFMVFAFLIKMPMFMFHFWLPKAHVQAPVCGSMILAGLFLKIGGYGIIRFMFIYEVLFLNYSYIWYSLSLWGSLLVSLICFMQGDIKCLIAYSSICHMGLCITGLMTMSYLGVLGSLIMMIGHGFCSSGMFSMVNMIYERLFSRSFYINKGMMLFMPSLSLIWFCFCCFNMGCPPSINFLSELIIMSSMISYFDPSFIFLMLISFFSSCFSIYLFMYVYHGTFHNVYCYSMVNVREYLLLLIHLFPLFFILFSVDMLF
uniref:NADH dehydrogenase subunit 4 n=1 Tax=Jogocerus viraktamathi TaxID=3111112 RepID=UPI002E784397|nr:NADH dehydrogenase subunit 4 [Jogocerus viraktamathi]WRK19234.1 NADH dehydrogenase subunit 4 [Jogocerus viraktamathi]